MTRFEKLLAESISTHGVTHTREHPDVEHMQHALTQHGYSHRSPDVKTGQKVYIHPHKATVVIKHDHEGAKAYFISPHNPTWATHVLSRAHNTRALESSLDQDDFIEHASRHVFNKEYHRSVDKQFGNDFPL